MIEGSLSVSPCVPLTVVDPLAALPMPPDDRTALRTWPWGPSVGSMEIREAGDCAWTFTSHLPVRHDASGFVPHQGLFMNGAWYPQVLMDGGIPVVDWRVRVDLPPETAGALASSVGEGSLRWEGRGERVGLAATVHGHITDVEGWKVLSRHEPRRGIHRRLASVIEPTAEPCAIVVAPMLRRLVRPGPRLLFLSDRAFRLGLGLGFVHDPAVRRGLAEASWPSGDPYERAFMAEISATADSAPSARSLLRWFSWIPQVDDLLYDGTTPFSSELFDEVWPGDPLHDDLLEVLDPQVPGRVRAAQAMDVVGEPPPSVVEGWSLAPPDEDYHLFVEKGGIRVEREAPPEAGVEPLVLEVDGERQTLLMGPGSDTEEIRLEEEPRAVVLDPEHHLSQDRFQDTWPARWTAIFAFFPYSWNIGGGRPELVASARLRRQYDTRRFNDIYLYTDEEDLVGAELALGFAFGPLLDRRYRAQRLYLWVAPALLDPAFRPVEQGKAAIGGGLTWVWDTQVDMLFPLRGRRLSVALDGGFVPGSEARWSSLTSDAAGVVSPHPRLALAGRAGAGVATGDVEHRLLALGGPDALRSLPSDLAVGHHRGTAAAELRLVPMRHASIPLVAAWWDEWQVSLGVEGGMLGDVTNPGGEGAWLRSVGWTAGTYGVFDILGARPALGGILLAGPLWGDLGGPGEVVGYLMGVQAL